MNAKRYLIILVLIVMFSGFTVNGQSTEAATELIPLPENARGPEIPKDKGYFVAEIKDGLYWVTNGFYNTVFLVYDRGVIAVDAPPTIGENYLKAIREVTDKPITHVIYSHSHTDHIGAAYLFPKTAKIIAQAETAEILQRRNDKRRPVPTITFKDKYELRLGTQVLQLDYHGSIHQPGNTFIYAPKQKVLMLVDVVYPGWMPFKNLGIAEDVQSYTEAHGLAMKYDFETFVGGHVARLGTKKDVAVSLEFLNDLQASAGRAFQTVSYEKSIAGVKNPNPWSLYNTYQNALVESCSTEMLPRWKTRIGGADVYMRDNCWTMIEALLVDITPADQKGSVK